MPADFQAALRISAARRGHFGDPAVFFAEAGSTNDVAAGLAAQGAPEGTIVVAVAQTAGRGRFGREWFSPAGAGLYVSVVSRNLRVAPLLTLAGGVAVTDGIRGATGLPVVIKWPNDVVVVDARRRKLAGVLAEGTTGPAGLQHVVLGFGINLSAVAYPPAIADRATSIETELGRPVDRAAVLAEILCVLNEHATDLAAGVRGTLLNRWRELAPSAVGARVEWTVNGLTQRGTTAGIDDQGALLVNGELRAERITSAELTWL